MKGPCPDRSAVTRLIATTFIERLTPPEGITPNLSRLLEALRPIVEDIAGEAFDAGVRAGREVSP